MLYAAAVFLIIALIAAVFGFSEVVSAFAGVARVLFWFFLIACGVVGVLHYSRRRI